MTGTAMRQGTGADLDAAGGPGLLPGRSEDQLPLPGGPAPHVALLDVTLRDGGYVNDHRWTAAQACAMAASSAEAGVGIVEAGYYRPRLHAESGADRPAACCPPAYLESLRQAAGAATVAVMVQPGDAPPARLAELADRGVGLVRLTSRVDTAAAAAEAVEAVRSAGMRASLNLVRISEWDAAAVAAAAAASTALGVDMLYLADSNGSLFPERVGSLFQVARSVTPVALGFHAHDGLSLAFANALAALAGGARYLDASLGGMGKGGGNLALELIAAYLHHARAMPYSVGPLARSLETLPSAADGTRWRCGAIAASLLDLNVDTLAALARENGDPIRVLDGLTPVADAPR